MRILILSPFPYHARSGHGGAAVSFSQLRDLAQEHEIFFAALASDDSESDLDELRRLCKKTVLIPPPAGKWQRRLAVFLGLVGVPAWSYHSPRLADAVSRIVEEEKIDLAIVQFPVMARYADAIKCRRIMDVQDLYSISSYRKFLAATGWKRRLQLFASWLGWLRYERKYYKKFDSLVVLTEQDKTGVNIFMPGVKADCVPLAPQKTKALAERKPDAPLEDRMVFVGWLQHPPNADAVSYFLAEIMPLIAAGNQSIAFHVVGRGVPYWMKDQENERIRFVGFVEDLDSYLAASKLVVIPIRFGGGVKIKTLAAVSNGCAIVSTSIGAEETGLEDGKDVLIRDEPAAFAKAVLELLADEKKLRELRQNVAAFLAGRQDDRKEMLSRVIARTMAGDHSQPE